jgi:hypothetical protein
MQMADAAGLIMRKARKSGGNGRKKDRREYFVYHGTGYVGRFLLNEKTRKAKAFNSKGKLIGEFFGFKAAVAAFGPAAPQPKRKAA